MTIWFASGNMHKKEELAGILSKAIPSEFTKAFEIKIPSDAGLVFNPRETGNSFLENALIKAAALYGLLEKSRHDGLLQAWLPGDPVIADDSGICVDAMKGRPGIHSARYRGQGKTSGDGNEPDAISDADRNALLLAELGDNPLRKSRFVCAMVLYYSHDRFFSAQESMEGELVKKTEDSRGSGGFGYDPILFIPELGRTVAELSGGEKNRLSHRGKAGRAIAGILFANNPLKS